MFPYICPAAWIRFGQFCGFIEGIPNIIFYKENSLDAEKC